jgi:hypothetical protein
MEIVPSFRMLYGRLQQFRFGGASGWAFTPL